MPVTLEADGALIVVGARAVACLRNGAGIVTALPEILMPLVALGWPWRGIDRSRSPDPAADRDVGIDDDPPIVKVPALLIGLTLKVMVPPPSRRC